MPSATLPLPATESRSRSASGSCTSESNHTRRIASRGDSRVAVWQRSGRSRNPCSQRPSVIGAAPPPCAKPIRSVGSRSSTPPKHTLPTASAVSAGMPTSHGNQCRAMRSAPTMSHGCTNTHAPSAAAASSTSTTCGSSRLRPFTFDPTCTPGIPSSRTHRSSSRTASRASCIGSVPSPTNRPGQSRTTPATWSFSVAARSAASCAFAQ